MKKINVLLALSALIVLSMLGCTESAAPNDMVSYQYNAVSKDYILHIYENETGAVLNGEPVELSACLLRQDDVFYFPLQAVTEALGGTYIYSNHTATINLLGATTEYTIGSSAMKVNGDVYENLSSDPSTPTLIHNTVYIPTNHYPGIFNGLHSLRALYRDETIIGFVFNGRTNERIVDGITLYDLFDDLPEAKKDSLGNPAVVGEVLNFDIEQYTSGDGLEVYVLRLQEGEEDQDGMDGRVAGLRVTSALYPTARGLHVGNTEDRAIRLYGGDEMTNSFGYTVKENHVISYVFYTNFYWPEDFES